MQLQIHVELKVTVENSNLDKDNIAPWHKEMHQKFKK